jgi:DNA polymerase III subunit delta'
VTKPAAPVLAKLADQPDRFPGALLLTGSSESRLEAESRRLAARLLCPGKDPDATCGSCRRVLEGLHPDFFTVEPEGVQIRVDRVREAIVFGAGRPYESALRVARILRADLLGIEGANALLKSLEEPGSRFRWIVTSTRPESLLPTIRSRTTAAAIPSPGRAEREKTWRDRGFSEDEARDLVLFVTEEEEDEADPAARLAEVRAVRQAVVTALEEGLAGGRAAALLILAETASSLEGGDARLLSEILADAALAAESPDAGAIRHRAVAGKLAEIARRTAPGAFRDAAAAAADPPPDNRRGNRRMHFEKLLLGLYEKRRATSEKPGR